jgi:hypothetical protein
MAYIGHRCACRHADIQHTEKNGKRSCGCSPCDRRCTRAKTPELLPTFDVKGRRVEQIAPPGERLAGWVPTCSCNACKSLYTELTGIELAA